MKLLIMDCKERYPKEKARCRDMPKRELDVPETFGHFLLMEFGPDDFWKTFGLQATELFYYFNAQPLSWAS